MQNYYNLQTEEGSLEECTELCCQHPLCVAFSWDFEKSTSEQGVCYFKWFYDSNSLQQIESSFVESWGTIVMAYQGIFNFLILCCYQM